MPETTTTTTTTTGGGRRPGRARRRVVAPPTGAPGEEVEAPVLAPADHADHAGHAGHAGSEDDRRWAAEAQRLLADRPPHWG